MDSAAAKLWTFSANDMEDESMDLIDSDEQLDPENFKKPDSASLWAPLCEEGGKKRKNCTCGLTEALEKEKSREQVSSSPSGLVEISTWVMLSAVPAALTLGCQPSNLGEQALLSNSNLTDAWEGPNTAQTCSSSQLLSLKSHHCGSSHLLRICSLSA